jgi:glycosyltransferase involved in cell wall biosynthesis
MISILIPVYDLDVTELVTELSRQLQESMPTGQIVVLDDGSDLRFASVNKLLETLPHTRFIRLEKNAGRIQARVQLAQLASNNWLLFVDGDSKIIRKDFIHQYINHANDLMDVIVGGREYEPLPPPQCNLRLHWRYGTERERIVLDERIDYPYYGFMSNNFLIKKQVFEKLRFSEALEGYGHEDTWIGIQLERLNSVVIYIDNPVLHLGVETADTFLDKTHHALKNLKALGTIVDASTLARHVKLFKYYRRLKLTGGSKLIETAYSILKSRIEKNLVSCSPSLSLFDLYRMNYFIKLMNNKKKI